MKDVFDVLTSHTREDAITTKLIQPPWFQLSEVLVYVLFSISFVTGSLKFQFDTFSCNVIECIYNETLTPQQTCPQFQTKSLDSDATYSFIDDKCRDQQVLWIFEIIPFVYFIIAIILWSFSLLWLNIPSCAFYIEHFVGLVKECNEAVEKSGWVYRQYLEKWKNKAVNEPKAKSNSPCSAFNTMPCKKKNKVYPQTETRESQDDEDEPTKDQIHEVADRESETLNNLHNRLLNMIQDDQKHHITIVLVLQQSALTFLSLMFYLSISCAFFWFDFLRSEYICALEEFSRIVCYYRLYALYWFLAVLFCVCNCFHCFLSCVHLCWIVYHSSQGIKGSLFPLQGQVPKDLSLMLNLLTTNDRYFCERVMLFLGLDSKNEVTNQVTLSFENLDKLVKINDGKQLTLCNLTSRPRSFDRLHRIENLRILHLINCSLTEFPLCILQSKTLVRVDFTDNKIQIIPIHYHTPHDKTRLTSLIIDKNPILPFTLKNLRTWTKLRIVSVVETGEDGFPKDLHMALRDEDLTVIIDEEVCNILQEEYYLVDFDPQKGSKYKKVIYRVQNKYQVKTSISNLRKSIKALDDQTWIKRLIHQVFLLEKALDQPVEQQQIIDEFNVLKDLYTHRSGPLKGDLKKKFGILEGDIGRNYTNIKRFRSTGNQRQEKQVFIDNDFFHNIVRPPKNNLQS